MLGKLRLEAPCPPAQELEFFNLFSPLRPTRVEDEMEAMRGWQVRCRGADAAVVSVSSRDLLVAAGAEAWCEAAEAQALVTIDVELHQRVHRFECEVRQLGWETDGAALFRLAALDKEPFARLFRTGVLEPALGARQLSEPWRWCAAGQVGAIADFDGGGFIAEDPAQVFEGFEAQHGAAIGLDVVLGAELVTWVPALIIRGPKPGWAKLRTVSDEVGVPIKFDELATFVLAHRRDGRRDSSWWREAFRRTFSTTP